MPFVKCDCLPCKALKVNLLKLMPVRFKVVVQRPPFLEQELAVALIDHINLSMYMDGSYQIPEVRELLM